MATNHERTELPEQPQPDDQTVPPIVCTLDGPALTERRLEWSDLGALSLTSERIEGGVASTYPLALADLVEDLANREASCCGTWLDSTTRRSGESIRLELTTRNPDGLAMIVTMAGFDK